jgi:hypothetical protein
MRTRRFTLLPGLAFAVLFTLLMGQGPVVGQADSGGAQADGIEGVWDTEVIIIRVVPQ